MKNCQYSCGRDKKHEHEFLAYKGIILPDNEWELKKGKGNPFEWSQYEVWHKGKRIGFIENWAWDLNDKDYSVIHYIFEPENND